MDIERLKNRINKKLYRREHRDHVRRWWADGGDERYRFDYPLTPGSYVLDMGGYEGQWASDIYARHRCRISVFEPVHDYAEKIRRRFVHNDDIEVFEFGLGESNRTEVIYIRGAGSSAYGKKAEETTMRLVDVKKWFDEHNVSHVDLMKINIEGGEFELLERMIECGLVGRVRDIQVQFHNIAAESTRRMKAIQSRLAETHDPTYQYKFVWENWHRKGENVSI
jgi:FkbM family methyltransferase